MRPQQIEDQNVDSSNLKKAHVCSLCGADYEKKLDLQKHINAVHLKLKPFKCDVCGFEFGWRTDMARHKGGLILESFFLWSFSQKNV